MRFRVFNGAKFFEVYHTHRGGDVVFVVGPEEASLLEYVSVEQA